MPDGEERSRLTGKPNRATTPAQQGLSPGAAGPFVNRLRHEAEHRRDADLRDEQHKADKIVCDLSSHFARVFVDKGGKARSPVFQTCPSVHVLGDAAYDKAALDQEAHWYRQYYDYMFSNFYGRFLKRFKEKWKPSARAGASTTSRMVADEVTSSTSLTGDYKVPPRSFAEIQSLADANVLFPRFPAEVGPGSNPVAFWSDVRSAICVRMGRVGIGVLAHEMCHAYKSRQWKEFVLATHVWNLVVEGHQINGGVASELADMVIASAMPVKGFGEGRSGFGSSKYKRSDAPSGYGGYTAPVKAMGQAFIHHVDGGVVPGERTGGAFFGGRISIDIDEIDPRRSRVRVPSVVTTIAAIREFARAEEHKYVREFGE